MGFFYGKCKGVERVNYKVIFQPAGRNCRISRNETILDAARKNGIDIMAACGGGGTCGKCKVRVEAKESGQGDKEQEEYASAMTNVEKKLLTPAERYRGYRLACMTKARADLLVYVPRQSSNGTGIILEADRTKKLKCRPNVKSYELRLTPPTLEDFRDDQQRLFDGLLEQEPFLQGLELDIRILPQLSAQLRKEHWHVRAVVWGNRKVIAVQPAGKRELYGAAIDLGTTTLAASLLDLQSGRCLSDASRLNSQIRYGDDVISRISYTMLHENGLAELRDVIRQDIGELLTELARGQQIAVSDIYEVLLAGNTVMEHIFLGLDPQFIGKAPFISTLRTPVDLPAAYFGLPIAPAGNVHFLPIEAGFVGADNVAAILAQKPYRAQSVRLLIDIGTNGELVLGNKERLLSTSCATGPALEGAQIAFGMRAARGAIEKVRIDASSLEPVCRVIGKVQPRGICGSGIVDAIAEMVRTGILFSDGSFNPDSQTRRLRKTGRRSMEYVLVWREEAGLQQDITVTQKDVRAVQLAKGALYAGAIILMRHLGIHKLDHIVLAGAFGSYIDKQNALYIGMFPECPLKQIEAVGNAAGDGAKEALLNVDSRQEAAAIARKVEFIETANEADFQRVFFQGMMFARGKARMKYPMQGGAGDE